MPNDLTHTVTVDIGGTAFNLTSDDTYLDQYCLGGFEPETVRLFKALANHREVILDIGANIGCTALLFGGLCKTVHAFEPSPTTFAFLERNVLLSGLKNVSVYNSGMGAQHGEYPLTIAPSNRSGAFVSNQIRASSGHRVETIHIRRMDETLQSLNICSVDVMKIDVEGFEGHVLRGAPHTLATYRPVVVLELNHWCLDAFQRTSVPDFFDFLRSVFSDPGRRRWVDLFGSTQCKRLLYRHVSSHPAYAVSEYRRRLEGHPNPAIRGHLKTGQRNN